MACPQQPPIHQRVEEAVHGPVLQQSQYDRYKMLRDCRLTDWHRVFSAIFETGIRCCSQSSVSTPLIFCVFYIAALQACVA